MKKIYFAVFALFIFSFPGNISGQVDAISTLTPPPGSPDYFFPESRPYIRSLGYAGAITPKSRFGAVEVVGRYGYLNLTDGSIDGGIMNHWYFGANWWASRQWKFGLSYGNCSLDRDALTGNTDMMLCRLLFMY